MEIFEADIQGVKVIKPQVFFDNRGFFFESYKANLYEQLNTQFVQENCSHSKKGTLRGMHYSHQAKLVSVPFGKVLDVVCDLRKTSPTYKKWQKFILDYTDPTQVFIPVGCAHGFFVLSDLAIVTYKVSDYYNPKKEKGLLWNDEEIGIDWPIGDKDQLILSEKDQNNPRFFELA